MMRVIQDFPDKFRFRHTYQPLSKASAKPGARLITHKPIGTSVLICCVTKHGIHILIIDQPITKIGRRGGSIISLLSIVAKNNTLGVNIHYVGREIHFTYPASMIIAQKP